MKRITADIDYCDECPYYDTHGIDIDNVFHPFVACCLRMNEKTITKSTEYVRKYNIEIPTWCPFEDSSFYRKD